jgi:hypothetical protein
MIGMGAVSNCLINFWILILDERLIPNPPTDIYVSEEIDTRVGFFGHVILNISWEGPQSKRSQTLIIINFK